MGWQNITVKVGEDTFAAHRKENTFSIPCVSEIASGDIFSCDGIDYKASSLIDWLNRGEVFHIEATEVKNDKPKTRRTAIKSGKPEVSVQNQHGRDDAD